MRKHGAQFAVPQGVRKDTPTGVTVTLFESEAFSTRYEAIRGGCATGRMCNASDDRTVYVLGGACVFLTYDEDGETVKDSLKCLAGGSFAVPRGTIHEIATVGDLGVELHIAETMLYDRHLVHLTAPVVDKSTIGDQFVERQQAVAPLQRREQDPNMVAYAVERAQQAAQRRQQNAKGNGQGLNANSANVIGVSPKPGGWAVEE